MSHHNNLPTNPETTSNSGEENSRSREDNQKLGKTAEKAVGKIILTKDDVLERRASCRDRIKNLSTRLKTTELQFAEFKKRKAKERQTISEKEFLMWEDDLGFDLGLQKKEIDNMEKYDPGFQYKTVELAEATDPMIPYRGINNPNISDTIEAYSGHFYDERRRALLIAITNSDRPKEEQEEDRHFIASFWQLVVLHVDYKHQNNAFSDTVEGERYDHARTKAHDAAVNGLNKLNELAEKYHTKRFTVRNFWDSTKRVKSSQETLDRARYDRDVVEEYYAIAFKDEIEAEIKKRQRDGSYY